MKLFATIYKVADEMNCFLYKLGDKTNQENIQFL